MSLYGRLYEAFNLRYKSELSLAKIQEKCNSKWRELKNQKDREKAVEDLIKSLKEEGARKSAGLLNYFAKASAKKNSGSTKTEDNSSAGKEIKTGAQSVEEVNATVADVQSSDEELVLHRKKGKPCPISESESDPDDPRPTAGPSSAADVPKPRQDALQKEIHVLETELNSLITKRDTFGRDAEDGIHRQISNLRATLENKKKILKSKVKKATNQKNFRRKQREKIKLLQQNSSSGERSTVVVRKDVGRPRLETDQPGLLQAICDIALHSGSADDRRRSERIRACKTLGALTEELENAGYTLSRSAAYLRLLPRSASSIEGKKHIKTVPVRLCRAQNDEHRQHRDQHFCVATINGLEEIASILGPKQVTITSHDDKAKVPLGMTAAKAQGPILMHVDYRVRLSDHDWSKGTRHKLTPSVYAGIVIKENCMGQKSAVTHSGPTYIAVRSGKHSSSTAATHSKDLQKILTLPDFQTLMKGEDGEMKPVHMISVDGGPDENPRYRKVIDYGVSHFLNNNLDALFIFTNAPGRSAFNRVERRMAPLSRALSGVILPHEHYGSHLDNNGKTVNEDLEKKNFQFAGETLAEIWSEMEIDGHDVTAEFIAPDETLPEPDTVSDDWYYKHVRESQYLLQVVKCDNRHCCSPCRSDLRKILFQRFLPAPYPLGQDPFGIPSPGDHKDEKFPSFLLRQSLNLRPDFDKTKEVPYDFYCPTVREDISKRICRHCGIYFASGTSLEKHRKGVHGATTQTSRVTPLHVLSQRPGELLCVFSEDTAEWVDIETVDENASSLIGPSEDGAELINDVGKWLQQGRAFIEDGVFLD